MNIVQQSISDLIPGKRKTTPSGWISFNAPCCHHRGERQDKRNRGGIIFDGSGMHYHCFNCGFKTGWAPGMHLGYQVRKLLQWMGANDAEIKRLVLEALRLKDTTDLLGFSTEHKQAVDFDEIALPNNVDLYVHSHASGYEYPFDFIQCYRYINDRGVYGDYDFRWCNETALNLNRRVIIPFTWNQKIVGWTARAIDINTKPKYYTQSHPGYVFNVDKQPKDAQVVIVCEGVFDAISINAVSVLGSEINEQQVDIIDSVGRQVVVVPDNDTKGQQLIDQSIEFGWSVSFPLWLETCKDINEAVQQYGKLFVVKDIMSNIEHNKLKIKLRRKNIG